jgi:methionyl-tRNA formyltransferase
MHNMHKIVFFGTPDFAVPCLRALANDGRFEIIAVVTRPDKPVGRKGIVTPPPVKIAAQELGIAEIRQPEKLKDEPFRSWINGVGPACDAFVVVAYGKIFRDWFLELPKKGLINVHASLLPRWRGASPISAAIAAGDRKTGVTIMKIVAETDAGPILAATDEPIRPDDTAGTLRGRLASLGASMLPDALANYLDGLIKPKEQDNSKAIYCKTLTREHGKIDWNKSAEEIERLIRAYTPWPGTWTEIDGKRLKILEVKTMESLGCIRDRQWNNGTMEAGSRFISGNLPAVVCGKETALKLLRVQPEGKEAMEGKEFLKGKRDWPSVFA